MANDFGMAGYIVLAVYMLATVLLGLSFTRKQKNIAGYFLAERSVPWRAVGISVLACDLSAISYMGAPSWTFYNNLRYALTLFVLPVVAIVVAYLFSLRSIFGEVEGMLGVIASDSTATPTRCPFISR